MASLLLFGCGGGGGGGGGAGIPLVGSPTGQAGSGGQNNGGQMAGNNSGGGNGGTSGGSAPVPATIAMANKLGKPSRVLFGLGATNIDDMKSQDIHPDIVERYLVGVGSGAWPTWNSPDGAYVTFSAQATDAYGAVPMFTLYQMTANGEGNLSGISDAAFMDKYWGQVR